MTAKVENYFVLPGLPWMILIVTGMYLMLGSYFMPSIVPFSYLGPLGYLARFLKDEYPAVLASTIVFCVVCHLFESWYCMQICRKKNISQSCKVKWFLSTMVFGGASLWQIYDFNPSTSKQE